MCMCLYVYVSVCLCVCMCLYVYVYGGATAFVDDWEMEAEPNDIENATIWDLFE